MSMPTQAPPSRGRQDTFTSQPPATDSAQPQLDGEVRDAIRNAMLHDLSAMERLLVVLWYAERMSAAEIAATLDMTELQVTRAHRLVLTKLRRHATA